MRAPQHTYSRSRDRLDRTSSSCGSRSGGISLSALTLHRNDDDLGERDDGGQEACPEGVNLQVLRPVAVVLPTHMPREYHGRCGRKRLLTLPRCPIA